MLSCLLPCLQHYHSQPTPKEERGYRENVVLRERMEKSDSSNSSVNWRKQPESFGSSLTAAAIWEREAHLWSKRESARANTAIGQSGVKSLLPCPIMCFIYSRDTEHTGTNYPSSGDPNSTAFSLCTQEQTRTQFYKMALTITCTVYRSCPCTQKIPELSQTINAVIYLSALSG